MSERAALPPDIRLTTMALLVGSYIGIRKAVEDDLERGGLTGSEFEVLIRLARSPGHRLRMSALAAQTIVTNSGLTRLVDRLMTDGLVDRVRDQRDRRIMYAELTPDGLELVTTVLPSHLDVLETMITGVLTDDELSTFLDALRKIRSAADARASADADDGPAAASA